MSDLDDFIADCHKYGNGWIIDALLRNWRLRQEQAKLRTHEAITEKATGDND